jgi:mRNA interferase YafQ
MQILTPRQSSRFKRDVRLMIKRGKNLHKLKEVVDLLLSVCPLPAKFKDHQLQGKFVGCRDCHLEPDWLLIYRLTQDAVIFERTGTHSDLFQK